MRVATPGYSEQVFSQAPSLENLISHGHAERVKRNGYYGGIRLLWAICHQVLQWSQQTTTALSRVCLRPRLVCSVFSSCAYCRQLCFCGVPVQL